MNSSNDPRKLRRWRVNPYWEYARSTGCLSMTSSFAEGSIFQIRSAHTGSYRYWGEISPIARYLTDSSGGQKNPSYHEGPCSKWRSKNRTSFRRVGRYTCGCPSNSVWSQVVPARGTPIPTNVGSVIERHLGRGSVRTPTLGWAACRARRRAGRGIDPRVWAGAPRPR